MNVILVILLLAIPIPMGVHQGVSAPAGAGVTQFSLAQNTALLAHNTLDGRYFHKLAVGDIIMTITGTNITQYRVTDIEHFKRDSQNIYSGFTGVDGTHYTVDELFTMMYGGGYDLVLQTCDAGLWYLFVIGEQIQWSNMATYW